MPSKLLKAVISLDAIEPEPVFILRNITPRYEYDKDGTRTQKLTGYVYDCISTASYDQYNVMIEQAAPLMKSQELLTLREKGENVFVTLENARIRAYFSTRTKNYEDSVRADNILLVNTNLK